MNERRSGIRDLLDRAVGAILGNLAAAAILVLGSVFVLIPPANPGLPENVSAFLSIVGTVSIAVASIWLGRTSARSEAVAIIVPLAMPAFRRTFQLFTHLGRIQTIAGDKRKQLSKHTDTAGAVSGASADAALEMIFSHAQSVVEEADNAFAEWEPIFPNEVKTFRDRMKGVTR